MFDLRITSYHQAVKSIPFHSIQSFWKEKAEDLRNSSIQAPAFFGCAVGRPVSKVPYELSTLGVVFKDFFQDSEVVLASNFQDVNEYEVWGFVSSGLSEERSVGVAALDLCCLPRSQRERLSGWYQQNHWRSFAEVLCFMGLATDRRECSVAWSNVIRMISRYPTSHSRCNPLGFF